MTHSWKYLSAYMCPNKYKILRKKTNKKKRWRCSHLQNEESACREQPSVFPLSHFSPPKNVSSPKVGLCSRMRNNKKKQKQKTIELKTKGGDKPSSVQYVLEMTQSRSCWNITGNKGKELNVPILPSSALHLLLWGAWCCRLKQPRQAEPTKAFCFFCFFICFYLFKTQHRTWNRFFPLSISSNPLNPFLPLPNNSWAPPLFFCPLDAVRLFAKNSKAKKIFFFWLLYCSLQRFYSVKKKKKRKKGKQINRSSLEESTIFAQL